MFGTMGISELIIILVIVLIIFGAGKLPQIGEGVGKALRGFKKEVNDIPPPDAAQPESNQPAPMQVQSMSQAGGAPAMTQGLAPAPPKPTAPYTPGPELTPGTTAAMMYNMAAAPQSARSSTSTVAQSAGQGQQPPTMEDRAAAPAPMMRAQYPPLPPGAQAKPAAKRPSAIVNKDAVARVQAQQAAMKTKATQPAGLSPGDMQSLGEGLGDALRTFKQAVADVRNSVDPEIRTIQAEIDSAQKELQQSIEAAKDLPSLHEEPPKQT